MTTEFGTGQSLELGLERGGLIVNLVCPSRMFPLMEMGLLLSIQSRRRDATRLASVLVSSMNSQFSYNVRVRTLDRSPPLTA
jgi:hypothetical protein